MATVTFNSQGGSAVVAQTVTVGQKATEPTDPFYADYTFGGWFTEYSCVTEWEFADDLVAGDMTLYAKWEEIAIVPIEVKTLLQITGTTKDDLIAMLIPIVQDDIILYTNNLFADEDGVSDWPQGIKLPAAEMIGYQMAVMSGGGASIGMQSESQGGYSYSRGSGPEVKGESGYPVSIEKKLNKWRLVKVVYTQILTQYRERRLQRAEALAESYPPQFNQPGVPL
jgi:uncharacterized repeat protein (TIGR02543 family)